MNLWKNMNFDVLSECFTSIIAIDSNYHGLFSDKYITKRLPMNMVWEATISDISGISYGNWLNIFLKITDQKDFSKFVARHKAIVSFNSGDKFSENFRTAIFRKKTDFRLFWSFRSNDTVSFFVASFCSSFLVMYLSENRPW